jgi:hypothetical protein
MLDERLIQRYGGRFDTKLRRRVDRAGLTD